MALGAQSTDREGKAFLIFLAQVFLLLLKSAGRVACRAPCVWRDSSQLPSVANTASPDWPGRKQRPEAGSGARSRDDLTSKWAAKGVVVVRGGCRTVFTSSESTSRQGGEGQGRLGTSGSAAARRGSTLIGTGKGAGGGRTARPCRSVTPSVSEAGGGGGQRGRGTATGPFVASGARKGSAARPGNVRGHRGARPDRRAAATRRRGLHGTPQGAAGARGFERQGPGRPGTAWQSKGPTSSFPPRTLNRRQTAERRVKMFWLARPWSWARRGPQLPRPPLL